MIAFNIIWSDRELHQSLVDRFLVGLFVQVSHSVTQLHLGYLHSYLFLINLE